MISKERLEELIEQEATIWVVYDEDRMERIKLVVRMMGVSVDEYNKIHNCEPMLYSQFGGIVKDICPISWLFETKEDAEWYKEFGCIVRLDRLELPNWKKLKCVIKGLRKRKLEFDCTCVYSFSIKDKVYRLYFCKSEDDYTIELILDDDVPLLNLQLTEENYIKACKVAKEKFLGEKNE